MTSKLEGNKQTGSDLEELIGSLGIDLYTPVKQQSTAHIGDNLTAGKSNATESSGTHIYSSVKSFQNKLVSEGYGLNEDDDDDDKDTSRGNNKTRNNLNSFVSINGSTIASMTTSASGGSNTTTKALAIDHDEPNDITTLRYGTKVILRGCLGKYLSAHYTEKEENSVVGTLSSNVIGVNKTIAAAVGSGGVYLLGVDGYGIGNSSETNNNSAGSTVMIANENNNSSNSGITDCLTFIPIESENSSSSGNNETKSYDNYGDENNNNSSDDVNNVITYGSTVAIRADGARQRLLGTRESSKLGFWRNLIGQNEKWTILKAASSPSSSLTTGGSRQQSLLLEDISSRGKKVHIGDTILLQAGPLLSRDQTATGILSLSEYILSLHEGVDGAVVRLINKDRLSLGTEHWLLESYHSQPIPPFLTHRPYLNGKYLLVSPEQRRIDSLALEKQYFPFATAANQQQPQQQSPPQPQPQSPQQQQIRCILRDLLLVLSGVEGQFIRVVVVISDNLKDNKSSRNGAVKTNSQQQQHQQNNNTLLKSSRLRDVVFAVQNTTTGDSGSESSSNIDRSIADQASTLFPLCQHVLLVREFLRRHSEYDFGLVSHALVAELKTLLREFELLIAQLEQLLLLTSDSSNGNGGLTLQKLVFLLQPSATIFRQLGDLCRKCDYTKGGELLNVLYTVVQEKGDAKMKRLFSKLFEKAFVPFRHILEHWLLRGDLRDTYHEFFIRENESIRRETLLQDFNAQYWEQRYVLVHNHVPVFMKAHAFKTLVAGKYLNVVKGLPIRVVSSSSAVAAIITTTAGGYNSVVNSPRGGNNNSARQQLHQQSVIVRNTFEKYDDGDVDGNDDDSAEDVDGNDNNHNSSQQQQLFTMLTTIDYDINDHDKLASSIEISYRYSSRTLLLVLEHQYSLSQHLTSLRRFFLFEHGDFFTQFMDIASDELCKSVKHIQLHRVQNLLQSAVQTSTLASDAHREGLTCTLEPHNLIQHLHLIQTAGQTMSGNGTGTAATSSTLPSHSQQSSQSSQSLTGFESLVLDYRVQWPLSIVLSRRAITKYQLLSRILFYSKYVELRILGSWKDHQGTKALSVRKEMSAYFCLRQRMLHFLQNFVYYMTVEVIKPRDHEMQVDMSHAQTMDEVLLLHEKFLDSCLKECLLASQEVLNFLSKILATCVLFADHVHNFMNSFESISIPTSLSPVRQKQRPSSSNNNRMSNTSNNSTSNSAVLKASNRRISIGSNNSGSNKQTTSIYLNDNSSSNNGNGYDDDAKEQELKLQHRARQTASDRVKRKLKQNMQTDFIVRESRQESFARYRNLFEDKFDKEVSEFLEKLWTDSYRSHPQLSNLCVRLDYNGYYSQKFVSDINY